MRNVVGSNLDGLQDTSEQLPKHVIPHRVDGKTDTKKVRFCEAVLCTDWFNYLLFPPLMLCTCPFDNVNPCFHLDVNQFCPRL